jgi:hypothetical protein
LLALAVVAIATTTVTGEGVASPERQLLPAQADPCPAAYPVARLTAGQVLDGATVETGTTPEPFTATVMGVIHDGIAPGVSLIIVRATSDAITRAGGIWAGMSGSPVYAADGRLVGAVAYGLAPSSPIAGVTPFAEMRKLLTGGSPAAAAGRVELTADIGNRIVASGAATATQVAAGLRRLPMPVAVSGLSGARLRRATRVMKHRLDGIRVYPAGRAPARAAVLDLVPGGNVGVALSYGDVTAAGIGTVTAVCDDEALLFGHPFTFSGATTLSAHQATALFVQRNRFGSFKVADLGGLAGTVDQDRLTGLRTELGTIPTSTRIHSSLSAVDSGMSRTATTRAVLPDFVAEAAFLHVLAELDRVHDRFGGGVVTLEWSARGKRSDGSTWRLRRNEKFADEFSATFFPALKVGNDLFALLSNPFDKITIDDVTVSGSVSPVYTAARLVGVEQLGGNGRWHAVSPDSPLRLLAGSAVALRGVFQPFRSTRLVREPLSLSVPRAAGTTGTLAFAAGLSFDRPGVGVVADNFADLLAGIATGPTGDTLRAELVVNRVTPDGPQSIIRRARATAPMAIFGRMSFDVEVVAAG